MTAIQKFREMEKAGKLQDWHGDLYFDRENGDFRIQKIRVTDHGIFAELVFLTDTWEILGWGSEDLGDIEKI